MKLNYTHKSPGMMWLLLLPVIAGIVSGSVWASSGGASTASPLIHQYFAPQLCGNTLLEVFRNTLVTTSVFAAAAFFAGLSVFGQPVGALMLIYRGFGIGASAAALYIASGFHGIPAALLLLLPKALAAAVTGILSVRECMRFSGRIAEFSCGSDEPVRDTVALKLYCNRFLVLVTFAIIIAAADTLLNYLFAGLL
ncbi:MAG: hypothetical protein IIZ18_07560 [Ruminococcus sp.]|nr:hypothetical protein [Ruminococcus sp.]